MNLNLNVVVLQSADRRVRNIIVTILIDIHVHCCLCTLRAYNYLPDYKLIVTIIFSSTIAQCYLFFFFLKTYIRMFFTLKILI